MTLVLAFSAHRSISAPSTFAVESDILVRASEIGALLFSIEQGTVDGGQARSSILNRCLQAVNDLRMSGMMAVQT